MSSASTSSLITNEAPGPTHLEGTVVSQKVQQPTGAVQCRIAFSIDEILKPSFGVKTSRDVDGSEPLDMRMDRNNDVNVISENEKLLVDFNDGPCPFRCSSPDQHSDSSSRSSSRGGSPEKGRRSSSADSNSYEYGKLNQEYKSRFHDAQMIPPYTESMLTFEDLHYITTRSYYNTLSHVYGFTNNAIGSRLFHHLGQIRHFMNPHSSSGSLSGNYICSSIDARGNTLLKIITANNNTNHVSKPKQASTLEATNIFQPKPTVAGQKPSLAIKLNSTSCPGSGRKQGHSAASSVAESGDSKANVKSVETCLSEVTRSGENGDKLKDKFVWPAWVYCTRYSDRPSSGPRYRKPRARSNNENDKRPRTAFSTQQLHRLRLEFETCPYLSETRRQTLALDLGLNESQVKIWFQNKRAKLKKSTGSKNQLALRLMKEGLYNHSTIVVNVDRNKCDPRQDANGGR